MVIFHSHSFLYVYQRVVTYSLHFDDGHRKRQHLGELYHHGVLPWPKMRSQYPNQRSIEDSLGKFMGDLLIYGILFFWAVNGGKLSWKWSCSPCGYYFFHVKSVRINTSASTVQWPLRHSWPSDQQKRAPLPCWWKASFVGFACICVASTTRCFSLDIKDGLLENSSPPFRFDDFPAACHVQIGRRNIWWLNPYDC